MEMEGWAQKAISKGAFSAHLRRHKITNWFDMLPKNRRKLDVALFV